MRKLILILCLSLLSQVYNVRAADLRADTVSFGNFGKVFIYKPMAPRELVLFISGDGGWKYGVTDMARKLADQGALVVGIDILRYWKNAQKTTDNCIYPSADFENLSRYVQQKYSFTRYQQPILVGYSSGATLAYGLMGQAPPETYKGALALGFCPDIRGKKPLCEGSGLHYTILPDGKGYEFLPSKKLVNPFVVLIGALDHICDVEHTTLFMKNIPGEKITVLPHVGHGFSKEKDWMPQFLQGYSYILQARTVSESTVPGSPTDLPITEIPSALHAPNEPLLIAISGDGGWKGFIDNLGKDFAQHQIPVVGLDALRYFWSPKTPEQAAVDITRLLQFYLSKWNRSSFVLVGYSFGANVMPFIVNGLPQDLQGKLKMIVLLSPDTHADFEFHVSSWFNKTHSLNYPLQPELARMKEAPTLVIYGQDEKVKPLGHLTENDIEQVLRPGDHHYGYDHVGMEAVIVKALRKESLQPNAH
jgi:type IV secretory pathway VirJ component